MVRLLLVLSIVALSWRVSDSCPNGYRPFSCTVCLTIDEDMRPFSQTDCPLLGIALVMDDVQNESHVLQRYLEVFNKQQLWTGYELSTDGEAVIPNTTRTLGLPIIGNEDCNNCCLAWQLHPYGLVSVDCEKELPAICTMSVTDGVILSGESSGLGQCGYDTEPGDVKHLTASAISQTELTVMWSPPDPLGTSDPLLLRYVLYFSSQDVIDEKSEQTPVIPQLPDGSVEVQLSDLSKGTKYTIGVVAISTMMPTAEKYPTLNTVVSTYGEAPAGSVFGVRLQPWKDDNKALIVSWETAQLSSPEGPVSSYEVEYRDGEQGLPNRVRVPPEAPYFIIYGVENDENYEVRVAILVEVSPLKLNRSQWTDWAGVNDTKSQGGEVQPTTEKGEVKPANNRGDGADVDVIVAAVLLPLTVLLVSILLFTTCLCVCCSTRSKQSYSVQKEEFSESVEAKHVTSTDV